MTATVWLLAGTTLAAISGFVLVLGGRSSLEDERRRMEKLETELQNVRGELRANAPRVVLSRVNERTDSLARAELGVTTPALQPASDETRVNDEAEETEPLTPDRLDERLAAEAFDPRWSREAEATARTAISSKAPGTRVEDVTCGSSLCRMRLAHEQPSAQKELAAAIAAEPPFASGTIYDYPDATRSTLYVARVGYDFEGAAASEPR